MINSAPRGLRSYFAYYIGYIALIGVSPIIALAYILGGMNRGLRCSYYAFACFMALLAYMLAPISDLASYGYIYYNYMNMPWELFASKYFQGGDFFMQTVEWFFANAGIPFAYMRFLQTLIAFILLNDIFLYKIDNNNVIYSNSEILSRYICYILIFPFILMVSGVRFGFGVVIMIYGFHLYIDRRKKILGLIFLLFSTCIHFSLFYYSIISLVVMHLNLNKKSAIALLVVVFVMSFPIQTYLESYFIKNDLQGAGYLGDGNWGRQIGKTLGLNAIIYHWGQRFMLLPLIYAFFKRYDSLNKWARLWFSYMLCFACMYSAFALAQRTTVCFMTCSIFYFLSMECKSKFSSTFVKVILTSAITICLFDVWTHREQLILSNYWRLIQPGVITLTQEYDKEWLLKYAIDRFT